MSPNQKKKKDSKIENAWAFLLEANQFSCQVAILQVWPRIWTEDYQEQIQPADRVGIVLRAFWLQF